MGFLSWKQDDVKTSQIHKEEGFVDLFQVQEVTKEVRFPIDFSKENIPKNSCFSVYYGNEFNLNVLILYSKDGPGVVHDWHSGMTLFCYGVKIL